MPQISFLPMPQERLHLSLKNNFPDKKIVFLNKKQFGGVYTIIRDFLVYGR